MLENPRILITGATGFIGQHLLEQLKNLQYKIYVLTRQEDPVWWTSNKNFTILKGDLSSERDVVGATKKIDIIVNLAAELRNTDKFDQTNVEGVKNLIKAASINEVKGIIHLSSVGVIGMQYSRKDIVVSEDFPANPKNEYERTKLIAENLFLEYKKRTDFDLTIIRPTNVFGEHHPNNVLLNFLQYHQSGKPLLYSGGAVVNYVYVKDLTSFITFILKGNHKQNIYNIGSAVPLMDFIKGIDEITGMKTKKILVPEFLFNFMHLPILKNLRPKLKAISNHVIYDDLRIKSEFTYPFEIKEGLSNLIQYYRQKGFL